MRDLDMFLFIISARYCNTASRVSTLLSKTRRISARPSCRIFVTVLIVVKEDNMSAERSLDGSEKHCCLVYPEDVYK